MTVWLQFDDTAGLASAAAGRLLTTPEWRMQARFAWMSGDAARFRGHDGFVCTGMTA